MFCTINNELQVLKTIMTTQFLNRTTLAILLTLSATTAFGENIYVYKQGDSGQAFLTNIKQNGSGKEKFTEISVTYYPDTKLHKAGDIPATYNPTTAATPSRSSNRNDAPSCKAPAILCRPRRRVRYTCSLSA